MIESMKKLLAILLLILTLSFLPLTALAQNIEQGDNIVLTKDRVVDKDYFAAGNSVTLEGTVNGDAYLAGGNIVINGTVNGDLLAAGGNIDVRGTVTGNIRAAGGNLIISGNVGRNISIAGGNINFSPGANVAGNLALAGGQITLSPQATVDGNLTYFSSNPATISQEATISGQVSQNIPDRKPKEEAKREIGALFSFFTVASFILASIIGIILIKLLPNYFARISGVIVNKPWVSLGIGLLTIIVFPVVFMLLMFTIIGIPIAIFLAFVLAVLLYLAKIFVAFVIGELILRRFSKNTGRIWAFLLGLVIYYVVTLIPVIGWLISVIAALMGLGAILIARMNLYRELRAKEII